MAIFRPTPPYGRSIPIPPLPFEKNTAAGARLSPGDLRWSGVPGAVAAGGPAGPGALSARGAKGLPVQRRLGPSGDGGAPKRDVNVGL